MRQSEEVALQRGLDEIVETLTRFERGDRASPSVTEDTSAVLRPVLARLASLGRRLEARAGFDLAPLLDSLPQLVARVDRELKYLYVNEVYQEWFGVTRDECLRGDMMGVLGVPVVAALRDKIDAVLSGEEQRFQRTVPYRGGPRHIDVHYVPDRADDGKVRGFFAIVSDVTAQKAGFDQNQAIVETMQEGLFVQNGQGRITYVNRAASALLNLDEKQILGRSTSELGWYVADSGSGTTAAHPSERALADNRRISNVQMGVRTPSGENRWLRVNAAPIATGAMTGDNHARVVVTFADVTAIVESEASFREVFDNVPVGIVKLDQSLRILSCNPAYAAMTGYSREELQTMTALDLTHPGDRQASVDFTRRGLGSGQGSNTVLEKRYAHKDGREIWVRVTTLALEADRHKQRVLLSLVEDVTEDRRIQRELVDAKDKAIAAGLARTQFLANMSHEIRTPLNGILGNLELLRSGLQSASVQQQSLADAAFSGRALLGILNDILDFSKIDAGYLQLEVAPFELQHAIHSVEQTYGAAFREKGVALALSWSEQTPRWVLGDSLRLRQILNNLVSNALKFTAVGSVRLHAEVASDGALHFAVSDSGIGISRENAGKLFSPFIQAESSTTRRFGGTGLGLSICRQLAELMGGDIAVSSEEGRGTTFTLRLPLRACDAPTRPDGASPTVERPTVRPLRVLVAEDNAINRTIVQRLLEQTGHEVVLVSNGAEAVERVAAERFDVVLMDCQMPVMDGYEATQQIVATHGTRRPVIVALTANAFREDQERCLAVGMDGYLSKPVSRGALEATLARLAPASPSELQAGVARRAS